ncbi:Phosphoribosylanthranilate isomerase [Olavius algarvensis spirochete endosymbiont]|uniref:bifunctional indole-3-glycerol phosphate synthase/phosphoribosylanthranilate isomerase n=1 Tax=Olavius algarvensis spirochete endosymbiont TaxID=260710 RepID=UPI00052C9714|nr:bifunctional indole-3-glycerol phosphate synthase/phosphoribosylanthranilate isomerase [Olavius algarvensis spirochete endosymbiont]KGM38655.1 hypothetical protein JY97_15055 [Alkalispirochaeta odontotermitis]CAD7837777.1 MAG: Phosphoribosylanthranilate isomerase (EC 5.3.1.24) [Olavius algarvensis spirochete endosymbiont]VDB00266.1 Phosphoribosylanthranilate isomerase [Olavius algarvensis spirochete endosymbiont]
MSEPSDILLQIASDRAVRIRQNGATGGFRLPNSRRLPLVPFANKHGNGILIAELKRRSPSKGAIASIPKPAALAAAYKKAGFRRLSVLTEETKFAGSLSDLVEVKSAHPELAVLRKDFLLNLEDVEVSCLAGADAILLIAALLDTNLLESMFFRAKELGMDCLIEVHTAADVEKVRNLRPPLVGINSRNLRSFQVDPLLPIAIRTFIDWPCDVIYESGIRAAEDALFVRGSGFSGFLVGEALSRAPELGSELLDAWANESEARRRYGPWERLFRGYQEGTPLVKICGITRLKDAEIATDLGADMIGFVMAESPRRAEIDLIRQCAQLEVCKTAVVVLDADESLPQPLAELLTEGVLNFIQFHGDERAETVTNWPGYKAIRLQNESDLEELNRYPGPTILIDAFDAEARGGTGKLLPSKLLRDAAQKRSFWLAGGLNPENVGQIVKKYGPGLVDTSSGVEEVIGRKNYSKIRQFIAAAKDKSG